MKRIWRIVADQNFYSISVQICFIRLIRVPFSIVLMKAVLLTILSLAFTVSAQSGRVKGTPTPTPTPQDRTSVGYVPTQVKTPPSAKPTPTPTGDDIVKVDSTLVPIPVSVLDVNGRSVSNLHEKDFELRIDGKVAEMGEIFRSDAPIRLAMLFDNSSSVLIARDFEREAAIRFFRRVIRPEKDQAALFSVADYTRLEQPFTSDVDRLTQAIQLFPEPKGATALFDGIVEAADYLKATAGRRVLVIVSDGEDTYSEQKNTLEAVIRLLHINNVQVYVVKTKDFENYKRTGERNGNANIHALTAERRMLEITAQTGGAVYSPIDEREMKDAFDRISGELAQQYVISYYPETETDNAGEFREIAVTVKTKQNVTVRARKGYYVPRK